MGASASANGIRMTSKDEDKKHARNIIINALGDDVLQLVRLVNVDQARLLQKIYFRKSSKTMKSNIEIIRTHTRSLYVFQVRYDKTNGQLNGIIEGMREMETTLDNTLAIYIHLSFILVGSIATDYSSHQVDFRERS